MSVFFGAEPAPLDDIPDVFLISHASRHQPVTFLPRVYESASAFRVHDVVGTEIAIVLGSKKSYISISSDRVRCYGGSPTDHEFFSRACREAGRPFEVDASAPTPLDFLCAQYGDETWEGLAESIRTLYHGDFERCSRKLDDMFLYPMSEACKQMVFFKALFREDYREDVDFTTQILEYMCSLSDTDLNMITSQYASFNNSLEEYRVPPERRASVLRALFAHGIRHPDSRVTAGEVIGREVYNIQSAGLNSYEIALAHAYMSIRYPDVTCSGGAAEIAIENAEKTLDSVLVRCGTSKLHAAFVSFPKHSLALLLDTERKTVYCFEPNGPGSRSADTVDTTMRRYCESRGLRYEPPERSCPYRLQVNDGNCALWSLLMLSEFLP